MPILRRAVSSVLDIIVPDEYKREAVSVFVTLTSELDAKDFQTFIDRDISIWKSCMPDELKVTMIEGYQEPMIRAAANVFPDSLALQWVLESRPDLASIFVTEKARAWFYTQAEEIRKGVGAT